MPTTSERQDLDVWFQIPATWKTYRSLLRDRGERSRPRYTFFNQRLTIGSPDSPHEINKTRLGGLIEDIFIGLRIPFVASGGATYLKTAKPRWGTEPDESYYVTNFDRVRGKKQVKMGREPAPDIVVEVVETNPLGDKLAVYCRFGVSEVWVCELSRVVFHVLRPNGRYVRRKTSACSPFLKADQLSFWAFRQDLPDELELRHEFRAG
jgi:Uma2 family endonuclease